MPLFAIFSVARPTAMRTAILARFPNDHLDLGKDEWLVSSPNMTSKDVADALGINDRDTGNAIVVTVAGYWGRAPNNVWEWIASKGALAGG